MYSVVVTPRPDFYHKNAMQCNYYFFLQISQHVHCGHVFLSKFFDFLVASSHEVEQCKTL